LTGHQDLFPVGLILQGPQRSLLEVDGAIFVDSSAFEKEALAAGRQWMESLGKEIWAIGPLEDLSSTAPTKIDAQPISSSGEDTNALAFLDKMHAKHGASAVVYVRMFSALSALNG
jgi:hypothetical protein